jgi:uncharacterized repeat protein (TIGR03803 family)
MRALMLPVSRGFARQVCAALARIVLTVLAISIALQAQTFTVLTNFTGSSGAYPYGGLMRDSAGTIYGTTYWGGAFSSGTMFAVIYGAEPVLRSFSGPDGSIPKGGLIRDSKGNLYGTTQEGGTFGAGTVFKLDTSGVVTTLHNFSGGSSDGAGPFGGLVEDGLGNLYGTTSSGVLVAAKTVAVPCSPLARAVL